MDTPELENPDQKKKPPPRAVIPPSLRGLSRNAITLYLFFPKGCLSKRT